MSRAKRQKRKLTIFVEESVMPLWASLLVKRIMKK
jgi:hypothetical protein